MDVGEGSNELDEYEFEFFSEEYENITEFDEKIEHYGLSYSLSDKIGYREEIYFYLLEHGFLPKDAWRATESIRIGKGLPTITDEMRQAQDRWILDECEKIQYLFPKASAIELLLFETELKMLVKNRK